MYPPVLVFDYAEWVLEFPEFVGVLEPQAQRYWNRATNWVSNQNAGYLADASRQDALNLMTAHIAYCGQLLAAGETFTVTSAASVDKVSVTLDPPESINPFRYWLNTSPYGIELLSLLDDVSAGGFLAGGSPESSAFRGVAGWSW